MTAYVLAGLVAAAVVTAREPPPVELARGATKSGAET